jgi:hypothetical protein
MLGFVARKNLEKFIVTYQIPKFYLIKIFWKAIDKYYFLELLFLSKE